MVWIGVALATIVIAELLAWRGRFATRAYPPRGRLVRVNGCDFHVVERGGGPCVILLHGTGGSLEDYPDTVFDALARDFRTVAVDRPGHGQSGRPSDADTPLAQARILRAVYAALGCGPAILVAHSWSGALALAYALEFPDETRGLILLQGTVYRQPSTVTAVIRLLAAPLIGPAFARWLMPVVGKSAIRRVLTRAFAPEAPPAAYLRRAQVMWARPSQARAIALDTIGRDRSIDSLSARYAEIRAPLNLVVGESDCFIDPAAQSFRFLREFPDTPALRVPGLGHQVPILRPDLVIEAVRAMASATEDAHA